MVYDCMGRVECCGNCRHFRELFLEVPGMRLSTGQLELSYESSAFGQCLYPRLKIRTHVGWCPNYEKKLRDGERLPQQIRRNQR